MRFMSQFQFQEEYTGKARTATVTREGKIRVDPGPLFKEDAPTGTGNINYTTNIDGAFRLNHISVKFASTPTQPVTTTLISRLGSQYNVTLDTATLSAGDTGYLFIPNQDLWFAVGDEINVTCAGGAGIQYGMRIIYDLIGETTTTSTSTSTSSTTTSSSTSTTVTTSTSTSQSTSTSLTTSTSSTTTSSSTSQSTSTSSTTTSSSTSTTQTTSTSQSTSTSTTQSTSTS